MNIFIVSSVEVLFILTLVKFSRAKKIASKLVFATYLLNSHEVEYWWIFHTQGNSRIDDQKWGKNFQKIVP